MNKPRSADARQPWIHSAALDSALITGPAFLAVALVMAFPVAAQMLLQ